MRDIVAAIQSAAAGQAVFGAVLAKRMQSWFLRSQPTANPEIGATLFLSPKTVANNISVILDKLQLAHRAEAIIKAREAGLGRGARST